MNYRIVEKPAFKVLGKPLRVSTKENGDSTRIPQFWTECWQDGTIDRLCKLMDENTMLGKNLLGVCMEYQNDMKEFTYLVAIEKAQDGLSDGFEVKDIPAANWAVFESIGPMPTAIQDVWKRIFSEFFPSTGYELVENAPDIEVYYPGSMSDPEYRSEVWIPIVTK